MSLYTLKELNNKPADIIRALINYYTTNKYKLNNTVKDDKTNNDNDWLADHCKRRECLKLISDNRGFRWDWVNKDSSK